MSEAHSVFQIRTACSASDGSILMWMRRMIDIGVPPDTVTTITNDVMTRQGARARLRRIKDARDRASAALRARAQALYVYCARRGLRRFRKHVHLGTYPNTPASQRTKPPNARTAISPNIRSNSTTHVD